MSVRYEPMLAVPWPRSFSDPRWLFEPKWDGIRALLSWRDGRSTVRNRRGNDITARYPELRAAVPPGSGTVDGEIVVLGSHGAPSFERLQKRIHVTGERAVTRAAAEHPVTFVAFDLLDDGRPRLDLGVEVRRELLESLGVGAPLVVGQAVVGAGEALWSAIVEQDLEGMVAKRLASPYLPGVRSAEWRKIVRVRTLRAVVGGYTPGQRSRRSAFGALVLGLWKDRHLQWIGNVGTGFSDADLRRIRAALGEMERSTSPFGGDGESPRQAVWVEPVLVARIGYREWTAAGRIRQPRFQGFTDDPSSAVTWEAEGPPSAS